MNDLKTKGNITVQNLPQIIRFPFTIYTNIVFDLKPLECSSAIGGVDEKLIKLVFVCYRCGHIEICRIG